MPTPNQKSSTRSFDLLSNEATRKTLANELGEIACILLSMRNLSSRAAVNESSDTCFILQTLAEKAGTYADRLVLRLGGTPVVGSWEDWAKLAQE